METFQGGVGGGMQGLGTSPSLLVLTNFVSLCWHTRTSLWKKERTGGRNRWLLVYLILFILVMV